MRAIELKTPAKINWFLHVGGRRDDGYHDIRSLIQCVSLYDTLTFEESDRLDIICEPAGIPLKENLVYKSAIAISGGIKQGAKITIKKHIPLASGLGGGSSDAACALMGLNTLWGAGLSEAELSVLAGGLGSDVPFFLNGPSAYVEGRGERITRTRIDNKFALLLVKPPVGVSSGWAYSELSGFKRWGGGVTDPSPLGVTDPSPLEVPIEDIVKALNENDFFYLRKNLRNDLEGPVFGRYPEIGEIKEVMIGKGALFSAMSGSGSTVFGVFQDAGRAEEAAYSFPSCWTSVVETL